MAMRGHAAAEAAFREGASEFSILMHFLAAAGQTEPELPYPAIVALDRHAAILHYQHRDRSVPSAPGSLLIDAGCAMNGYASDITRTHSPDDEFSGLIAQLDEAQQRLCAAVKPGVAFVDLHQQAHTEIAGLIHSRNLVRMPVDELVATGITKVFFPHGLGHFLGLRVHDAGGFLGNPQGTHIAAPDEHPYLRLTRTLEPGQVLTIEPGFYFIDTLLEGLAKSPASTHVDWDAIERLKAFGGIRIEDNLLVTDTGAENLTRGAA